VQVIKFINQITVDIMFKIFNETIKILNNWSIFLSFRHVENFQR